MHSKTTAILWFRKDLRLLDNEALQAASAYQFVIPLFIWDPEREEPWQVGAASRWFLHHALEDLSKQLAAKGSRLIFKKGLTLKVFEEFLKNHPVDAVFWNKSYEPSMQIADAKIENFLQCEGIYFQSFENNLLFKAGSILKRDGKPYLVYTAFWRECLKHFAFKTKKEIHALPSSLSSIHSDDLRQFELLPDISWDTGFYKSWKVTEKEAHIRFDRFLKDKIQRYETDRNLPSMDGTSTLSPYLHWGLIHPHRLLLKIKNQFGPIENLKDENLIQFCKELVWREFSYHLLFYYPKLSEFPMKEEFLKFPWVYDEELFAAWKRGKTGYPIVDAGMRQLWKTGWMHNRVRMIVASFLIKDLNISWKEGARWFWDTLVDADLANNTQGWQWVAGCGFDAAPFFRIFNPITQGESYDPDGLYVKTWCPELAKMPAKWIHKPWLASKEILAKSHVSLGRDYPLPIVDHVEARNRSLSAFKKLRLS